MYLNRIWKLWPLLLSYFYFFQRTPNNNLARSICQYSNMDPRLSGHFLEFVSSFNSQKRFGYEGMWPICTFAHNRPFSLGRFVFPLQTTWYSLENCSLIHLKIIYSYAHDYLKIWKGEFSRVLSHGLKWGNKPPSRKGLLFSLIFIDWSFFLYFQRKGQPYCHNPCYASQFGPGGFGHGGTESHKYWHVTSVEYVTTLS